MFSLTLGGGKHRRNVCRTTYTLRLGVVELTIVVVWGVLRLFQKGRLFTICKGCCVPCFGSNTFYEVGKFAIHFSVLYTRRRGAIYVGLCTREVTKGGRYVLHHNFGHFNFGKGSTRRKGLLLHTSRKLHALATCTCVFVQNWVGGIICRAGKVIFGVRFVKVGNIYVNGGTRCRNGNGDRGTIWGAGGFFRAVASCVVTRVNGGWGLRGCRVGTGGSTQGTRLVYLQTSWASVGVGRILGGRYAGAH